MLLTAVVIVPADILYSRNCIQDKVNTPLNAIIKIVGPSPRPNHTMERGTQAIMGTWRRELINGAMAS